ncbi:MAG: glycosyltransferase [Proteobacteria bacterium]|nr:glycosyltransferase [Pseudomonadota bacterium]MBU1710228.1 glycosyltransferase [Pseudomonadota bacterium]
MINKSDNFQKTTLVFVVAYHAENHIESLFERIPEYLFNNTKIHFLVIDDASSDKTVELAANWTKRHGIHNVSILQNPVNQGYGGNQKLGYRYAIDNGFDLVVLLHGDGQYTPELLPEFLKIREETGADVILGSRMVNIKDARLGGMPFYKLIGNRILTGFQNLLTGMKLAEYHTGYRAYSTRFLQSIPFEINTNDFHFDTEIILQAHYINAEIVEFPIPTHYGDEKCHVNGLRYALKIILSTTKYVLHRIGMMCSLKYRNIKQVVYSDKKDHLYSSHTKALQIVKDKKPKTILDVGCGPGFIARHCESLGAKVTGLDYREPLQNMMSEFIKTDLEHGEFPADAFKYDLVLLLDVLEHLSFPEQLLLDLRNNSQSLKNVEAPLTVISTPNIAFIGIRINLLFGRFNYAERGILDITHKRLFTRSSLKRSLIDSGYIIEKIMPIGAPFQAVISGWLGKSLSTISNLLANLWPTMFAFQFMVLCRPRPGIKQILEQTKSSFGTDQTTPKSRL